MVVCPKCGAKLPDWQTRCQFCQEPLDNVVNQMRASGPMAQSAPKWTWIAYYVVCAYYVIEGLRLVFYGVVPTLAVTAQMGHPMVNPIYVIVGLVMALFGAGLAARIEFVRGIANVVCWILIVFGFLMLAGSVMVGFVLAPLGLLFMFFSVLRIATAGFMIYLIGETERSAPNI